MRDRISTLDELVAEVRQAIRVVVAEETDCRRVEFDSALPPARDAHGLFDPGARVIHLSPERSTQLRRLVFDAELSEATLPALMTLVHELLHSASPALKHPPAALSQAQSAGWVFWEEGLVSWWARQVGRYVLGAASELPTWRELSHTYSEEAARMQWLEATFGAETVHEIWRQPTAHQRIMVANRYVSTWLGGCLLQNGMATNEVSDLLSALGDRVWEVLQRGYHLLLPRMTPESASAYLRGTFGLDP